MLNAEGRGELPRSAEGKAGMIRGLWHGPVFCLSSASLDLPRCLRVELFASGSEQRYLPIQTTLKLVWNHGLGSSGKTRINHRCTPINTDKVVRRRCPGCVSGSDAWTALARVLASLPESARRSRAPRCAGGPGHLGGAERVPLETSVCIGVHRWLKPFAFFAAIFWHPTPEPSPREAAREPGSKASGPTHRNDFGHKEREKAQRADHPHPGQGSSALGG